jgi:hypothetical protein
MKLVIAGGRDFVPEEKHWKYLSKFIKQKHVIEIVSGCARGADRFGEMLGEKLGIPVKKFPADWSTFGLAAGFIRNRQMAEYADAVFLFPGGKGTKNMKEMAFRYKRAVFIYPKDDRK